MPSENSRSRRNALKSLLLIFGGFCLAVVGSSALLGFSSNKESPGKDEESNDNQAVQKDESTSVTIKVVYFGMSIQTTGTKEEYLKLPSPVHLEDVLAYIKQEHVVLAAMLPVMQIVVNGVPTQDNPLLLDNTEVDLIPIYAGG